MGCFVEILKYVKIWVPWRHRPCIVAKKPHSHWSQIAGKVLVPPPTGCVTSGEWLNPFYLISLIRKTGTVSQIHPRGYYHASIMLCFTIWQYEENSKEYWIWNLSETGFIPPIQGMMSLSLQRICQYANII